MGIVERRGINYVIAKGKQEINYLMPETNRQEIEYGTFFFYKIVYECFL